VEPELQSIAQRRRCQRKGSVKSALAANGVSDGQGPWTSGRNTAVLTLLGPKGHTFTATTAVTWHRWVRADGPEGTDTAGGSNR